MHEKFREGVYASNVVYGEVLRDAWLYMYQKKVHGFLMCIV